MRVSRTGGRRYLGNTVPVTHEEAGEVFHQLRVVGLTDALDGQVQGRVVLARQRQQVVQRLCIVGRGVNVYGKNKCGASIKASSTVLCIATNILIHLHKVFVE